MFTQVHWLIELFASYISLLIPCLVILIAHSEMLRFLRLVMQFSIFKAISSFIYVTGNTFFFLVNILNCHASITFWGLQWEPQSHQLGAINTQPGITPPLICIVVDSPLVFTQIWQMQNKQKQINKCSIRRYPYLFSGKRNNFFYSHFFGPFYW